MTGFEIEDPNREPVQKDAPMHLFFAVVFALNYMMGSGFLTLPHAFVECSVPTGVVLTLVIAFGATVSAECLLDAIARARVLARYARVSDGETPETEAAQRFPLVADLCATFLGEAGRAAYVFMLCSFMLGSLWCYAAIFSTSMMVHLGHVGGLSAAWSRVVYVVVFGAFVTPLSLKELADQKRLQSALAIGRTLMLAVMVVTSTAVLLRDGPKAHGVSDTDEPWYSTPPIWRGLGAAAPIIAYSCTLHHSVPQIIAPLAQGRSFDDPKDALTVNSVFRAAFLFAACIYVAFAVPIAAYFGKETKDASNLDWETYRGVWCASILSRFVVLYPSLNVAAAYPLCAITLGDTLHTTFAARRAATESAPMVQVGTPPSRETKLYRALAALPPLVGAALVDDIGSITRVTGTFGLAMCAIIPGLLALAAKRRVPEDTPFKSRLNTPNAARILTICGIIITLMPVFTALVPAVVTAPSPVPNII